MSLSLGPLNELHPKELGLSPEHSTAQHKPQAHLAERKEAPSLYRAGAVSKWTCYLVLLKTTSETTYRERLLAPRRRQAHEKGQACTSVTRWRCRSVLPRRPHSNLLGSKPARQTCAVYKHILKCVFN